MEKAPVTPPQRNPFFKARTDQLDVPADESDVSDTAPDMIGVENATEEQSPADEVDPAEEAVPAEEVEPAEEIEKPAEEAKPGDDLRNLRERLQARVDAA